MNSLATVCLGLSLLGFADESSEKRKELDGAIEYGIELLEAGRYRQFVLDMAHPADLNRAFNKTSSKDRNSLEAIVAGLEKGKAEILLMVLKQAETSTPNFNPQKTKATMKVTGKDLPKRTLTFEKHKDYWYLRN